MYHSLQGGVYDLGVCSSCFCLWFTVLLVWVLRSGFG